MTPANNQRDDALHDLTETAGNLPRRELELLVILARVLAWAARWLLAGVLVVSLAGPLPPLLPRRYGPATYTQYRARCAATISPAAWLRSARGAGRLGVSDG